MKIFNHWQLPKDGEHECLGIDDIHQCIHNILNTPKGTDILRPEFGSNHFDYIDQPTDEAIPNIAREIFFSLQAFEPRIEIIEVKVAGEPPILQFEVYWKLVEDLNMNIYKTVV